MRSEEIRFGSGEETCGASLFLPATSNGPTPCVVMGSGLSAVRDQGLPAIGERFADAGIAALSFDYRYCGDSGGEPRSLVNTSRQRDDWRAAIAFARTLESVDPGRLAIWGYSLGGAHVQFLAATEPGIAAAVCISPLIDALQTLRYVGGPLHPLRLTWAGLRDWLRVVRRAEPYRIPAVGPPGSLAALNSADALPGFESITPSRSTWRNEICARNDLTPPYRLLRKVRHIDCPILYCITEDDDICPPELGKQAAKRAPRGELRLYPGGHFDAFRGETFERVCADQLEFLRRNLLSY